MPPSLPVTLCIYTSLPLYNTVDTYTYQSVLNTLYVGTFQSAHNPSHFHASQTAHSTAYIQTGFNFGHVDSSQSVLKTSLTDVINTAYK